MSRPRLIELIFGVATAVAQVIVVVILFVRYFSIEYWFEEILGSVLFLLPALIVLVGSYVHVVDGKGYGRVMLGFGALVMGALGLVGFLFGGFVYAYGLALAIVILLPDAAALVSFVASLFVDIDR
jgi:hypothetical protein